LKLSYNVGTIPMYYPIFLILNALEMVWEARIASRNSNALLQRGAVEYASWILPVMFLLYIALYIGSFAEYLLIPKQLPEKWFFFFVSLYIGAKGLKYWAVSSLGSYWTMKVLIVPGSSVVTSGPYRWVRHPNYIAVLLEIAATALAGKSYITLSLVFLSFSFVLYNRIKREEEGLAALTDYSHKMMSKGRFL
jgi:methyltransferase